MHGCALAVAPVYLHTCVYVLLPVLLLSWFTGLQTFLRA